MYKVIMAPTEGSDSERAAISVAAKLAQRFDADLRLVQILDEAVVIEPVAEAPMLAVSEQAVHDARLVSLHKLEALGVEIRALGDISVITALEDGPVAPALRDYAGKFNVDLIVMSSHSRGGFKRIAFGSITDYLIRNTTIPVLVVKTPVSSADATLMTPFSRIVVPLDGSRLAEQILPEVVALASQLNSTVSLLQVRTPVSYSQAELMQPGMPWWDADIGAAEAYLSHASEYLTDAGLTVSQNVVLSDNVPQAILDYSHRMRADLIALTTNGSGGIGRLLFGTVADEITRKAETSLLVFHPTRSEVIGNTRVYSRALALAGT
jgi:nucleotide-binding universal stress UspA family protein